MNCCNHDCDQGRSCATRKTRRVRAGQPVGDDTGCLPVQYTQEQIDQWKKEDDRMDLEDWLTVESAIALAVVVVVWLVAVGGMFV